MKACLFRALALAAAFAAFTACTKHNIVQRENPEPHGGQEPGGHGGQGTNPVNPGQTTFKLEKVSTWTIGYSGREDLIENGLTSRVDRIKVSGTGSTLYLVSLIKVSEYDALYNGDLASYLKDEAKNAAEEYRYRKDPHDILFDRLHSGEWYGYIIGLNDNGEATGQYNYISFTVEQETPTPEYEAWLGDWCISRGNVAYNVSISQDDANYSYRLDGWETGNSINANGTVMDQEWLITWFEPSDGNMYFVSSFIGNYDDDNLGNVDEIFMGQVNYNGVLGQKGLYIIDKEGLDLAYAELSATSAEDADIYPCEVIAEFDWGDNGKEEYETTFAVMQYMCYAFDSQEYYLYNDNVPLLPLSMHKTGAASPAPQKGITRRGAVSSEQIVRTKVKVHQEKTKRATARKAAGTSVRTR